MNDIIGQTSFSTGVNPQAVAVADFNHDGNLDIVVANSDDNTLTVILGNGINDTLGQGIFSTGTSPQSVAVADFNLDEKLDIVVANSGNHTVTVILGNGVNDTIGQSSFSTGKNPRSVAVVDFNLDGKPDVVIANYVDNTVTVLLGNGVNDTIGQVTFPTGGNPRSVAVGDFNLDGKPDIVVANFGDNTVAILLGNGVNDTIGQKSFPTGKNPQSVVVGDFNLDGKPDVVVANFGDNTLTILLGNGQGSFIVYETLPASGNPSSIVASDFNGDDISPSELVVLYEHEKILPDFNLLTFVNKHFHLPSCTALTYTSDPTMAPKDHINKLWDLLSRPADTPIEGSSKIPLPFPYVVPGGRFQEIFYWDSYFTMLGLILKPEWLHIVRGMIDNFAYMIDRFGFIPNGSRTYFLSRSQPPFFAEMIQLLADTDHTEHIKQRYLPQLLKEYEWWMTNADQLTDEQPVKSHVVRLPDGTILNRYWDPLTTPRPEAYPKEEAYRQKAEQNGISAEKFYQHIRAACESGWDFSSRWLIDTKRMETNHAADIVPIDLNCLLYSLENLLESTYNQKGDLESSKKFGGLAENRKNAIQNIHWNNETKFFMDYDWTQNRSTPAVTLAGVYPLFFKLATLEQAAHVHERLEKSFLQSGGLVTTLERTGEQWDWPNGWAPLQWIAYQGLKNYGFNKLAAEVRLRWLTLNDRVFKETGKMTEKYNVVDNVKAGGGNYPLQDGFGWTNGVYLKLLHDV
ncbi:unnamed protein product [Rotaria sp. Silwood1]|nr:unnamed protein product [Rotaria sp. Silwood1]CAF1592536.1 unnamed protein product [Rotaria sp. Silwood1]CAF3729587.1 unnamed protein product [Rotaria sp. Silwood1]